jgi:protoporphyrinogen oxidase
MSIAILGGGISGLSLCEILYSNYSITCDLYEKEGDFGGLCRTRYIDGYTYDVSGGHVFNSKSKAVLEYVFSKISMEEWIKSERRAKILYDESTILDYPFEFSLSQLPTEISVECIEGLYTRENKRCTNLEEFFINTFGRGIYDHYLKQYNEKIWKTPLNKMDYNWVEGKLPLPDRKDILARTLSQTASENSMVHSSYYYPKEGGIRSLINAISTGLPKGNIYGIVENIEIENNRKFVNGKEYDLIINTIPLPELSTIITNMPQGVKKSIESLCYNSLLTYIFESDPDNDWSWLYIPNLKIPTHRLVYQGNFSKKNAPYGRSSFTAEVTTRDESSEPQIREELVRCFGKQPLDSQFTKYAYVIYDLKRSTNYSIIEQYFMESGIYLHGRFARWTYPNMDDCIKKSMDLAIEIISSL